MMIEKSRGPRVHLPLVVLSLLAPLPASTGQTPDPGKSLAPFVPSPMEVVEKMLEMAEIKPGDTVYDLGCGDGRIVVTAARKYGARGVGVDLDPKRVEESKERARQEKVEDRVEIRLGDALEVDLEPATVVALYLLTDSNRKLKPILQKLHPGARVVSHNYEIPGWKVVRKESVKDSRDWEHVVYLYRIEASPEVTGTWSWTEPPEILQLKGGSPPRGSRLLLIQEGDRLTGALRTREGPQAAWKETPISAGKIKGDELEFAAEIERGGKAVTWTFRGKREGDVIRFTKEAPGSSGKWSARREFVDPVGTWRWMENSASGAASSTLEIRREKDLLAGLLDRKRPVDGLTVQGARIRFEVEIPAGGEAGPMARHLSFRGVIDGDSIVGSVKEGAGEERPWKAVRSPNREGGPGKDAGKS